MVWGRSGESWLRVETLDIVEGVKQMLERNF